MQTEELSITEHSIYVGVPMMDESEARSCVTRIKTRIDIARGELLELHDREGWKALGYKNWSECARGEFGMSVATLYRQLEAAEIMRSLDDSQFENLPTSHLQAVKHLAPEQRVEAITRAREQTNGKPTAKAVQHAAAELSAPDLPPEFAIVQRRYERHGYALASAWDGVTQRFVVRKDGGTGAVLVWDDVLSRLERVESEPSPPTAPDPATELEIKRLCAISGSRYLGIPTDLPYPTETRYRIALANHAGGGDYLADEALGKLRAACTATENPPPAPDPAPADNAAAWQYQEAQDASLLSTAQANIGIGNIGDARRLLGQVSDRSSYARDRLLATIPPIPAGRRITLEFSPHDCAALLKEAKAFNQSGLTKRLPAIGQTLVLLVEAIKQP